MKCLICGKNYNSITNTHLKKHNLTLREYLNKFPQTSWRNMDWLTEEHRRMLSRRMSLLRKLGIITPSVKNKEQKKEISNRMIGVKNPNYIDGGTKKLQNEIEKQFQIQEGRCLICGDTELVTHHLDTDQNYIEGNIKLLCSKCHNNIHQRGYNFTKKEWTIKLSEWFTSIQGEGISTGIPMHFIRTQGCQMGCLFCDSKFTWTQGQEYNYIGVVNIFKELVKNSPNIKRLCLTGGSPEEQNITPLLMIAKCFGFYVEIEINGSNEIKLYHENLIDQFNVSIKLSNNGQSYDKRINQNTINYLLKRNSYFKFVVSKEKDVEEVRNLLDKFQISKKRTYLMPEGKTTDIIIEKTKWLIENYAKKESFNISTRLHIILFNNKRAI